MEKVANQPVQPIQQVVPQPVQPSQPVMKKVTMSSKTNIYLAIGAVLIVLLGVLTGWKLSGVDLGESKVPASVAENAAGVNEAGSATEQCSTEVEGTLEEGGIEGEGTHHLVRSADASKNVYVGSTSLDLQRYIGKKVKITGQTMSAKKAPWLMDVCKIKVS